MMKLLSNQNPAGDVAPADRWRGPMSSMDPPSHPPIEFNSRDGTVDDDFNRRSVPPEAAGDDDTKKYEALSRKYGFNGRFRANGAWDRGQIVTPIYNLSSPRKLGEFRQNALGVGLVDEEEAFGGGVVGVDVHLSDVEPPAVEAQGGFSLGLFGLEWAIMDLVHDDP